MASKRICSVPISSLLVLLAFGAVLSSLMSYTSYYHDFINERKINSRYSNISTTTMVPTKKPESTDVATSFAARRRIVNKICKTLGTISAKRVIIAHRPHNISVCLVQKAGCTIWLRLFKFLAGQKRYTGSPMSISKHEVHYNEMQYFRKIHLLEKKAKDQRFISNSLKVMTVRDPWTRLWSAYIDKLVLPDFWKTKGVMIIKLTRPNASANSLRCGNDVTFAEFIQYVVKNGHSFSYLGQDSHWLPASDICNPCSFKPDLIMKQETFMPDFKFVMEKVNLSSILANMTLSDPIEYEIINEIKYNFDIANIHSSCSSIVQICARMWQAFIFNGYIPPNEKFPSDLITNKVTWDHFYEVVEDVRARNNITKWKTKMLRKQTLTDAYTTIPKKHLIALQKLYALDFELFGYDKKSPTL